MKKTEKKIEENNVRRHKEEIKGKCSTSYCRTYKTYMENTNESPNTFSPLTRKNKLNYDFYFFARSS